MSKYIIDLRPDCKVVQQICESNGQVGVGARSIQYLEELTADYINEHFSDLQDTAYQKGFEDGKKEAESSEAIEQAKADAFNKGILFKEEKIHDAYQRGLEDGKWKSEDGCTGCEYKGKTGEHLPCEYCINNFTNQWKPKDVQFEFGDEIIDSNGVKGCVISMNNEKSDTMYALFGGYRVPQCICQKNYRKTGKHYDVDDIKKLLEDMRHD